MNSEEKKITFRQEKQLMRSHQPELLLIKERVAEVNLDWDLRVVQLLSQAVPHQLGLIRAWLLSIPAALLVPDLPLGLLHRTVTHLIGKERPEPLGRLQSLLKLDEIPLKLGLLRPGGGSVALVQTFLEDKLGGGGQCCSPAQPGRPAQLKHLLGHLEHQDNIRHVSLHQDNIRHVSLHHDNIRHVSLHQDNIRHVSLYQDNIRHVSLSLYTSCSPCSCFNFKYVKMFKFKLRTNMCGRGL